MSFTPSEVPGMPIVCARCNLVTTPPEAETDEWQVTNIGAVLRGAIPVVICPRCAEQEYGD